MLNLHKSQLVQAVVHSSRASLDLGWLLGTQHHQAHRLDGKVDGELAWFNWASLYGLNFYREYVPAFAKLVKLLCQLLGQDARPWMIGSWGMHL